MQRIEIAPWESRYLHRQPPPAIIKPRAYARDYKDSAPSGLKNSSNKKVLNLEYSYPLPFILFLSPNGAE